MLMRSADARILRRNWQQLRVADVGWRALAEVRGLTGYEALLTEVDSLLLRLLDRLPGIAHGNSAADANVMTFQRAELERLQSAAAATLVSHRWGAAGLRVVLDDQTAPRARRYYAFLCLAEWHRSDEWPLFTKYLAPSEHFAFVAAAAEALRFYPDKEPAGALIALFNAVRNDQRMRAFLGPRILQSLYVLRDAKCLDFLRGLLVVGHTAADPVYCEVTRALAMIAVLTGKVESSIKYADRATARAAVSVAIPIYEELRSGFIPVSVI